MIPLDPNNLTAFVRQFFIDYQKHKHKGTDETQKMDDGLVPLLVTFETGELGAYRIYFPFAVRIKKIRGRVVKAIEATNNGTITGANSAGNSTNGAITATAADAFGTEYSTIPTDNNVVAKDSYYQLTTAKTTAGGKVQVTLEYDRA